MFIYIFLICAVLILSFVNGFTDGVNSISSVVTKGIYNVKKASLLSGVFNILGCFIFCVFYGKVSLSITGIINIDKLDSFKTLTCLSLSLISVSIFASFCWWFKIATSESQGLIGALYGAYLFLGKDDLGKDVLIDIFKEQAISIFLGIFLGFFLKFVLCKYKTKVNSKWFIKILMSVQSFLHGGQDGQKFYGIILASLYIAKIKKPENFFFLLFLVAGFMGLGTLFCGRRIIDKVNTISKMDDIDMISSDMATVISIFISTLKGIPISTTYVKISSVYGTSLKSKNKNNMAFFQMILGWVFTFPICSIICFALCYTII